jgi:hypothetical protein
MTGETVMRKLSSAALTRNERPSMKQRPAGCAPRYFHRSEADSISARVALLPPVAADFRTRLCLALSKAPQQLLESEKLDVVGIAANLFAFLHLSCCAR